MPDVRPRERPAPAPAVTPPRPPAGRRRPRKGWWAASGLLLAMLLGGGLYVAYRATAEKAVPAPNVPALAVPAATLAASEPAPRPSAPRSEAVAAPVTAVPNPLPTVTKKSAAGKPNPAGTNLALTAVVAASSTEADHFSAAEAVDGDPSTRWSSGFAEPQWLRLDLRERRQLTEVTLVWEHAYAIAYSVDVSVDGRTWQPIFSTVTGRGGTVSVDAGGTVARFVRMVGTKRSNRYGFSLFEFQVR